jgi:hypothetical protein
MRVLALDRGDSAFLGSRHVRIVYAYPFGASIQDVQSFEYDMVDWSELSHAVPFAMRMYVPDGSLSDLGRKVVQAKRDAEPSRLSNRRRAKLYAAALREDRARNVWMLEEADDRLLSYAY